MKPVIVAGHVCVDLTPAFDTPPAMEPGRLIAVGPLALTAGGCVSNTGLALASLGVPTQLVASAGADELGRVLVALLATSAADTTGITCLDGRSTSYSIVVDVPGRDRTLWHHIGANSAFDGSGVVDRIEAAARLPGADRPVGEASTWRGAAATAGAGVDAAPGAGIAGDACDPILHLGYPTHLPALYADGGAALVRLVHDARAAGATVSLDMAEIDPASEAGAVDWENLMAQTLASVDVMKASVDDLDAMLPHRSGLEPIAWADLLVELGVAVALVTAGADGLYVRTASAARIRAASRLLRDALPDWASREIWAPPFTTHVVRTTGAGDAAAAGFLAGLAHGRGLAGSALLSAAAAAARISGRPIGDAHELAVAIEPASGPRSGWSIGPDRVYHGPRDKEV
jgi:sugar/nucleoside kinase (ribokinase family)